jgi:hypothetical protein
MKRIFISVAIMTIVLVFSIQAHAALQNLGADSLGNRLIYDSDLNITWYDYTTYGSWQNQVEWASALSVDFGSIVYDDWRLPITFDQSCSGFNCTNSEMGHLYYTELGNTSGAGGFTNTGDFQTLQAKYWSVTEYSGSLPYAWGFVFEDNNTGDYDGYQSIRSINDPAFALAVRPGLAAVRPELVAAVAPEPISSTLFIVGGATLGLRRWRKKRKTA